MSKKKKQKKDNGIIIPLMEKFTVNKAMNDSYKRYSYGKKNLSPSTDFSCPRKAYYNVFFSGPRALKIEEDEFSYENERAKNTGNYIHAEMQQLFQDMGILVLNETTLEDKDLKIRARLDSVVCIDGELVLIEIKSAKNYSIKLMQDEHAADYNHVRQIQTYFHLLELNKDREDIKAVLQGREIKKGVILYENKNDHSLIEFVVKKNLDIIKDLKKYAKYVWKHIELNQLPDNIYDETSDECRFKCSYFEKCYGKPKPLPDFEEKGGWGSESAKEVMKDKNQNF